VHGNLRQIQNQFKDTQGKGCFGSHNLPKKNRLTDPVVQYPVVLTWYAYKS